MVGKPNRGAVSGRLFAEPQGDLFERSAEERALENSTQAVDCMGVSFESDESRREYYLEKLREKLQDPEFRETPGFPRASDDDILRLSDPPFYTACPNPFIREFVEFFGRERSGNEDYHRAPYAADVREGRNDPIYRAHTYHTKVPPRAAAQYILHYTNPGDIVLDAFGGSGMTGVAARLCGDPELAAMAAAEPGARAVIVCDLSPAATFIAATYLSPPDPDDFLVASEELLVDVEAEVGPHWRFQLEGSDCRVECQAWSEVLTCPQCQSDIATDALMTPTGEIGTAREFCCSSCSALVSKAPSKKSAASRLVRNLATHLDPALGRPVKQLRREPVATQCVRNGKRLVVPTTESERKRLSSLGFAGSFWYPTDELLHGERFRDKDCLEAFGITHVHHFYLPRALSTVACMWDFAGERSSFEIRRALRFFVQSNGIGMTVLNRYVPSHYSHVSQYLSGTLYVPSMVGECSHQYTYANKRKIVGKAFALLGKYEPAPHLITTQSATNLSELPDSSIDYVFVDPPFGKNLQYSELNQVWEAWLKVRTDRDVEAVVDRTRGRDAREYGDLMTQSFCELARVLKPGRWTTVVFHNSSNVIWIAIQEAMFRAGLVIADVRTLDKERETYKQSRQGVVKADLVISAYKPSEQVEQALSDDSLSEDAVWSFVDGHLAQLPVFVGADDEAQMVVERQPYMLFDRLVAAFVQRLQRVPLSYGEFVLELGRRHPERDGMYFLPSELLEYDKQRAQFDRVSQLALFVTDEATAIQWVRQELQQRPSTFQDLQPRYMQASQGWAKHEERIELSSILEDNFLEYDGEGPVPAQVHSYLSSNYKDCRKLEKTDPALVEKARDRWFVPDPAKQGDLEQIRSKRLLAEFEEYRSSKQKKLKQLRTESIRAGFGAAWNAKDFEAIVDVAKKIPDSVLQEDPDLLMYFDNAMTLLGTD